MDLNTNLKTNYKTKMKKTVQAAHQVYILSLYSASYGLFYRKLLLTKRLFPMLCQIVNGMP